MGALPRPDDTPRPALEARVREIGAALRGKLLMVLAIVLTLPALLFGVLRFAGNDQPPTNPEIAWMIRAAPAAIALAAAAIGACVLHARSTRSRLTVHLERERNVLTIGSRPPLRVRGPFGVSRTFHVRREHRRSMLEAVLVVSCDDEPVVALTESMYHRPPDDWDEGSPRTGAPRVYEVVGAPCLVALASKLASDTAGALDDEAVERLAEAMNAGKARRKKSKKAKG
jgi:hypothetical protein